MAVSPTFTSQPAQHPFTSRPSKFSRVYSGYGRESIPENGDIAQPFGSAFGAGLRDLRLSRGFADCVLGRRPHTGVERKRRQLLASCFQLANVVLTSC